ncbi:MAG TPA: asparagine synthase-related protein, partial [Gammaproteobacteria bacterium]|nr:asparagine synthase-related protein [Gammaproteobacteria bacterium]
NFWLHRVELPERYLCKVDRCSMANSLEARVPFLDHRIVELLSNVSSSVKMPGFTRKAVLRRTIGKRLPEPLLSAPKRGFDPPMRDWVNGDAREFWSAAADRLRGSGLFSRDGVKWVAQSAPEPSPSTMGRWLISMLSVQLGGSPALEAA